MSANAARQYNLSQARRVTESIQRIISRINNQYYPDWLIAELNNSLHDAQCIEGEFTKIINGFGDDKRDEYNSGYAAYENGDSIESNPHGENNQLYNKWKDGYLQAEFSDTDPGVGN